MFSDCYCLVGDISKEITAYIAPFGVERLQEHVRFERACSFLLKTSYIKSVRRPVWGWCTLLGFVVTTIID